MKIKALWLLGFAGLLLCSCQDKQKDKKKDIVSQRYIHKYGYDVSRDEWDNNHFPGQVITTLKNGITISSSYEDGVLHGKTTYTYPHSQTLESLQIFERGNLIKKVSYDVKGTPTKEELYLSPTHVKAKYWYKTGTPKSIEEYIDNALVEGEYFTINNETESRIENGRGLRSIRSFDGTLIAKETIENGKIVASESFHHNGTPHVSLRYLNGMLHGEKKIFAESGEPVSIESYDINKLHGMCTYYQNGYRYKETPYDHGLKNGIERHYIDGETLIEETEYHDNLKHGPSTFYCDGIAKSEWYYNNELVSKSKYEELLEREKMISIMHERSKTHFLDMEMEEELQEEVQ